MQGPEHETDWCCVLAGHLAWRYLRKRRIAWLALVTAMLSVAIPVMVIGVIQGFVDISEQQIHGAESDIVVKVRNAYALPYSDSHRQILQSHPEIKDAAPYAQSYAVLTPVFSAHERRMYGLTERDDARLNIGCQIEGVDWQREQDIQRLEHSLLHKRPGLDLSADDLAVDERGSGFLTPSWRAYLAMQSLNLLQNTGVNATPLNLEQTPIGIILGHELMYTHGTNVYWPGRQLKLTIPNSRGGLTGRIVAEISDTIGTGYLEFDRTMAVLPLPNAQVLADMDGEPREITGYRVQLQPQASPDAVKASLEDDPTYQLWDWSYSVRTWDELGSVNMVKTFEVQRNIMVLVMLLVQLQCIFIVYAVFSTLVSEKKHDIGILLGIGARRRSIISTFILASLLVSLVGGLLGWAVGWGALSILNPLSDYFGIALFPQDVIYTPDAPISWDPRIPLFFLTVMLLIGFLSVLVPAWRASRIMPLESIREQH